VTVAAKYCAGDVGREDDRSPATGLRGGKQRRPGRNHGVLPRRRGVLPFEESETLHGLDAVRRYFEGWLDTWDPFQVESTEFLARGDHVVAGEAFKGGARAAAPRSPCRAGRYRSCAMALSFAGTSSWTVLKPSKPPGLGSSEILRGRCRRRT
jgi:hypothetical protein